MDAVYIVGPYSRWNDNELRYSLRSLEKYVTDLSRVFLVGHKPRRVCGVVHIPARDPHKNALSNLIHKLRLVVDSPEVGNEFMLMNDDFWITEPWDSHAVYHMGTLADAISKRRGSKENYYYKALVDCDDRLRRAGVPVPLSFDPHCPMKIETSLAINVLREYFTDENHEDPPGLFRSFYGNSISPEKTSGQIEDNKLSRHWRLPSYKFSFVSADDFAIQGQWARLWFKRKYPEASRFEEPGWEIV